MQESFSSVLFMTLSLYYFTKRSPRKRRRRPLDFFILPSLNNVVEGRRTDAEEHKRHCAQTDTYSHNPQQQKLEVVVKN